MDETKLTFSQLKYSLLQSKFYLAGSCPSSHKYAYLNGEFCCRTNKEKIGSKDGYLCDGSEIGIESRCCENDDYSKCAHNRCHNHESGTHTFQCFFS